LLSVVGVANGLLFVVPLVDAAKGLCDPDVGVEVEGEPGLPFGRVRVRIACRSYWCGVWCGLRSVLG